VLQNILREFHLRATDHTISFDQLFLEHVLQFKPVNILNLILAGAFVHETVMFVGFMRKISLNPMTI